MFSLGNTHIAKIDIDTLPHICYNSPMRTTKTFEAWQTLLGNFNIWCYKDDQTLYMSVYIGKELVKRQTHFPVYFTEREMDSLIHETAQSIFEHIIARNNK